MAIPRKPSATIVDLARHCGVSTSTVSLALARGSSRVITATRERVRGGRRQAWDTGRMRRRAAW
jgi:DNA-binding MarR family transcriptional regulator